MGVNECPLVIGFEQLRPGEVVEFEWTHQFELYRCSGAGGTCEGAHAIPPGDYEVSV
jgi:hypothetical protein